MDAPTRYEFMHQAGAVKSEDGRFVLYSEYARIVAEKDARIAELEAQAKSDAMDYLADTGQLLDRLETARRDALEEAAKMAEGFNPSASYDVEYRTNNIAAAIRALAEKG